MAVSRFDRRPPERDQTRINERIRVPEVRMINEKGEQVGVIPIDEALKYAQEQDLDLVAHEGGNAAGRFCFTLTVTDIATGWTENRTVPDKRQVHVVAAITEVVNAMPFPIKGIDCDNGGEVINDQL